MRVGIHVVNFNWPGEPASIAGTLRDIGEAAETAGIVSFSFMDHWFQMESMAPATDPMLEGYTSLGFMAANTSTLELGLLVTGVSYRRPGLLAKIVTTLDVLSSGRAHLGIGAAWYEREHRGLGVPFAPVAERFERLEETLQICLQMWSDNDGPYDGKHYQLGETICRPRPISQPRPQILIGGSGEKKTLKLVARYADACNIFDGGVDAVAHKLDVLRGHCEDEKRDFATIRATILAMQIPAPGDVDGFVETMRGHAAHGVKEVILMPRSDDPVGEIRAMGERLVPALAEV